MDRILIILKKENGPRASSAPALGLNTIIFKYVYWYMKQTSGERLQDHWSSSLLCFLTFVPDSSYLNQLKALICDLNLYFQQDYLSARYLHVALFIDARKFRRRPQQKSLHYRFSF